eukprot:CAMPEP_0194349738 /NCGR_PEP_ID=MMETSP0171-20130528/107259_1 /TAXON_ID=218684 /ORGANISM="Corethron pennatum, Strain L29A3" /LENGTH=171 /DNA_ID=CAMNT_0039117229 /DNA_START=468 /DNA_END=979 /DNA_ORIENTATION=-
MDNALAPLTLDAATIKIKSNKCAVTKVHLIREEYMMLGPSYGLHKDQREVVYDFCVKYEEWLLSSQGWDEADRVLYVLKWGPSVFSDSSLIPLTIRTNSYGESDVLNFEKNHLYPFFLDVVVADESQDFVCTYSIIFNALFAFYFFNPSCVINLIHLLPFIQTDLDLALFV